MNNYDSQRRIITVTGDDAKLVRLAEQLHIEAARRIQSDAGGAIAPMVLYETEAERQVMSQLRELEKKYQMAYGLMFPPTLVAASAPKLSPGFEVPVKRAREAPSDMELADLFLKRVKVKRCGESIYWYNGMFYQLLTINQFHTLIQDTLRVELSISGSSKQLKSVATAILADSRIEVKPEDKNVGGICLRNGVLSLVDFKMYEHSPDYFFTWMLDVAYLGEQECPYCDQFFAYAAGGDPTLIQRFWEALAYALFPDYRAKRFVLLMGKGDTGKSVYGSVIESFFDKDFVGSVDIFKFGERFHVSTLAHKCVNISMDLNNSALNEQAVGLIKQITGGDLVMVEEKYRAPYATRIDCTLVFGTNHALRTNTHDMAFLRRVLYLPFDYAVPHHQQNKNLRELLRAEKSGIFCKVLKAYRGLVAKNYFFSGDDIYDFTKAYQVGENVADQETVLEEFVNTHCRELADNFVTTDELFARYQSYCQGQNHAHISNKQVFSAKFNAVIRNYPNIQLGKKRVNGTPCNGYKNLALV